MGIYKTYNAILDGYNNTESDAIEYACGMVWSELDVQDSPIAYANYIDTIDGVGVYYDYGADYYFFTDETEDD